MEPRSRYHETITSLNQSAPAAMKILIKFLSDTLAGSRGHINYVAPRRRPQIDPAGIVSPFFLRYAEIVVDEEDLRRTGGIFFVNFDERVDPASIVGLGEIPVEVILPEDTRITFVREDERV